ncbi:MAG: sodium:alanine symporter family protein [Oscillospiraceae bacterium]|nr:sodium:alanine symporter family protein [Oscillospiraceae bacterium]
MDFLNTIERALNSFLGGPIVMALLVGVGVYLSIAIGFPQFTRFGYAMRNTIGKAFKKSEAGKGEITPFQAVSTALASTVGTGNIVGVTSAVVIGGPGAVFWMWLSAIFGMVTKFSEVALAVKYRERNDVGDWVGGPMYYIKNGMGKKWKWLGTLFCIFGALAAMFGIGNLTQINSIAGSVNSVVQAFNPAAADKERTISLIVGIIIAAFVAVVLIGGIKRIGQVTEKLVPFMAVVYIIAALIVVIAHANRIPAVLGSIFVGAFNPNAVVGGATGVTMRLAMTRGIGRGLFSNEAGMGSAPIAHASTSERDPVKQGLYGIFEVFTDTIVICTLTTLVVLCGTTPDYGNASMAGVMTTVQGFASVFGEKAGSILLSLGLLLFATSTILGWALYGTRCIEFVLGPKARRPYEIIFCIMIIVGSVTALETVWNYADTLNSLMMIPNLIALLFLSPVVIKMARDYFKAIKK